MSDEYESVEEEVDDVEEESEEESGPKKKRREKKWKVRANESVLSHTGGDFPFSMTLTEVDFHHQRILQSPSGPCRHSSFIRRLTALKSRLTIPMRASVMW